MAAAAPPLPQQALIYLRGSEQLPGAELRHLPHQGTKWTEDTDIRPGSQIWALLSALQSQGLVLELPASHLRVGVWPTQLSPRFVQKHVLRQ